MPLLFHCTPYLTVLMLWLLSNTLARKSAKSSSSVQYNFRLVTWQLCAMPAARRRNVYSWYLAKWSNRSSSSAIEAESVRRIFARPEMTRMSGTSRGRMESLGGKDVSRGFMRSSRPSTSLTHLRLREKSLSLPEGDNTVVMVNPRLVKGLVVGVARHWSWLASARAWNRVFS